MNVASICSELKLKVLAGDGFLEKEITTGYCCDLLSWVMAHGKKNGLWITVQTHTNIIAIATLLELSCIIIPEKIEVDPKTLSKAVEEGIPILSSHMSAYELSGRLYQMGILGS